MNPNEIPQDVRDRIRADAEEKYPSDYSLPYDPLLVVRLAHIRGAESEWLRSQQQWISVEERLPERNEDQWGYDDDNNYVVMFPKWKATVLAFDPEIGMFKAELNKWGWSEIGKSYVNGTVKPTHWCKLPPPPQNK